MSFRSEWRTSTAFQDTILGQLHVRGTAAFTAFTVFGPNAVCKLDSFPLWS